MTISPSPYAGVSAAALTPMNADLTADLPAFVAHCRWLLSRGCNSVGILGSTGEANSFSASERKAILEGVVSSGIAADTLLPSAGCNSVTETVDLASHAAETGCPGVLILPPFFYKNPSEDGLFDYFAQVVEGTKGKVLLYLYNFPQQSTVPFELPLIDRLLTAFPGIVRGVKDSGGKYEHTKAMIDAFASRGFEVFTGSGEFLRQALRDGAVGCITAAANINSHHAAVVYNDTESAAAEVAHDALVATRNAVKSGPSIPTLKEIFARASGNDGWRRMRPPHRPLGKQTADSIWDALSACNGVPAIEA